MKLSEVTDRRKIYLDEPPDPQENSPEESDSVSLSHKLSEIHQYVVEDLTKLRKTEEELRNKTNELSKRIKELNCLYSISKLIEKPEISIETILHQIVNLILEAWQYPDITCARIRLGGKDFKTKNFKETIWKIVNDFKGDDGKKGIIEVCYLEERHPEHEGPFLNEERQLINALSERLEQIIEYKRAVDMLQSERDKFYGVLNAIGEGMYIVSKNYQVEYQNEVLKERFGDQIHKKCFNAFMKLNKPCEFCPMPNVLKTKQPQRVEVIAGDSKNYEFCASCFTDVDGKVKLIQFAKDITEKKKLEAEAIRIAHLASLGELAAGVAHEINNPINSIINLSQIILNESDPEGLSYDIAKRIMKEGDRIADIVSSLLSFSRGKSDIKKNVSLKDILSETLDLCAAQMRKSNILLKFEVSPDLPTIMAHFQQIQQVFLNIISNAHYALVEKFPGVNQSKVLEIKADIINHENVKYVRVIFTDNGTGIPSHLIDKVMLPFISTKPKGVGTGLGLSISHGIIKDHQGNLKIESKHGHFTSVIVEFPSGEIF